MSEANRPWATRNGWTVRIERSGEFVDADWDFICNNDSDVTLTFPGDDECIARLELDSHGLRAMSCTTPVWVDIDRNARVVRLGVFNLKCRRWCDWDARVDRVRRLSKSHS